MFLQQEIAKLFNKIGLPSFKRNTMSYSMTVIEIIHIE